MAEQNARIKQRRHPESSFPVAVRAGFTGFGQAGKGMMIIRIFVENQAYARENGSVQKVA